jgi:hypothetical protein
VVADAEAAVVRVEVEERARIELDAAPLHFPKPWMQPSPQYAIVDPHHPKRSQSQCLFVHVSMNCHTILRTAVAPLTVQARCSFTKWSTTSIPRGTFTVLGADGRCESDCRDKNRVEVPHDLFKQCQQTKWQSTENEHTLV